MAEQNPNPGVVKPPVPPVAGAGTTPKPGDQSNQPVVPVQNAGSSPVTPPDKPKDPAIVPNKTQTDMANKPTMTPTAQANQTNKELNEKDHLAPPIPPKDIEQSAVTEAKEARDRKIKILEDRIEAITKDNQDKVKQAEALKAEAEHELSKLKFPPKEAAINDGWEQRSPTEWYQKDKDIRLVNNRGMFTAYYKGTYRRMRAAEIIGAKLEAMQ